MEYWRENKELLKELEVDVHEFPKSHFEIYKYGQLQRVVYSQESLNLYLKTLKGRGWFRR